MANTKVRQDEHGVYIRTNGSVYRPQMSKWSYPSRHNVVHGYTSLFTVGQPVRVGALSGSPLCTVRTDDRCETWHTHGQYGTDQVTWNP